MSLVACAERQIGASSPMNAVERIPARGRRLPVSDRPVMVNDWAESLVDLEWRRCLRRHPSNPEPSWAEHGGADGIEWDV